MNKKVISIKEMVGGGYNALWNSNKFYNVVKGGRGSKKSVTMQYKVVLSIMENKAVNWLVVRRYSNTLRHSCYSGIKWAVNRLGVRDQWEFTVSPMEATYIPTGQKILFRGMDDPLKLTSIQLEKGTITDAWFEEAYEIESMDKIDTVTEGMRGLIELDPDYKRHVYITFNPWSEFHWLKSRFFDSEQSDVFTLTTTYKNNEFLDNQTIERYESLFKTNRRRAEIVCNGNWGIAEGLVFENVKYLNIDRLKLEKQQLEMVIGLDFGFTHDPTALIVAYLDEEEEKIYLVEEMYKTGMLTGEIAAEIKKRGYGNSIITADNAEGRLITELRREHGLKKVKRSKKGRGSVKWGLDKLLGYEIICDSRLKNMQAEFSSYSYKFDKVTGKYTNEVEDANNHLIDALRYAIERKGKVNAKGY